MVGRYEVPAQAFPQILFSIGCFVNLNWQQLLVVLISKSVQKSLYLIDLGAMDIKIHEVFLLNLKGKDITFSESVTKQTFETF